MVILDTIKGHIDAGDRVLAAVSGGRDSMCLLHMLSSAAPKLRFFLAAATVNHNLRGEESERDAALVQEYCARLGVSFFRCDVHVDGTGNLEQRARQLRYDALHRVARQQDCNKIAVAHHANDNAEGVLLNLFRGAGGAGLAAMSKGAGMIVRPLLLLPAGFLQDYATAHDVPFAVDSSNLCNDLNRNYIRNQIMPLIDARFGSAVQNISSFSQRAAQDEEFICSLVEGVRLEGEGAIVPLAMLSHPSLGVRAIKKALALIGVERDVCAKNYDDIISLKDKESNKVILLKHGAEAVKLKNAVLVRKSKGDSVL